MKKFLPRLNLFVAVFIFLFISPSLLQAEKIKIKIENGIQVVYNPKNPAPPPGTPKKILLREDLCIGDEEGIEDFIFSQIRSIQVDEAYYALPYNPYGERKKYAWAFPARWFNMKEDKRVLIGAEFWEKIGGVGTYQSFISAVNEIGREYKERIYREFLGIEPPKDAFEEKL